MCTLEKRGNIFYLTLTGDDEHRLNPTLISSLLSALQQAKSQASRGSLLLTTSHGKFFSNGFDLAWAQASGSPSAAADRLVHMVDSFKPVISALISLPMPTVAALPGHAAAAGLMLALGHDYVMMRSDRGVLYMSEVDIGLTIPDYFTALVRAKIGSAAARRDVLLQGAKIRGEEAVRMGIVESAHDSEEKVLESAVRLGEHWPRGIGTVRCTERSGRVCTQNCVKCWDWRPKLLHLLGFRLLFLVQFMFYGFGFAIWVYFFALN